MYTSWFFLIVTSDFIFSICTINAYVIHVYVAECILQTWTRFGGPNISYV